VESLFLHIFNKPGLQDITEDELLELTERYPYFPNGHLWLTQKYAKTSADKYHVYLNKMNIYAGEGVVLHQYLHSKEMSGILPGKKEEIFNNELVNDEKNVALNGQVLENVSPSEEVAEETTDITEEVTEVSEQTAIISSETITDQTTGEPEETEEIKEPDNTSSLPVAEKLEQELNAAPVMNEEDLIKPLYTEDYFAAQGIKLPEKIDSSRKPTEAQLRSFTDWLRSTKRPKGSSDPDNPEESTSQLHSIYESEEESEVDPQVEARAMNSIASNETVITEAMAEVRILQGQYDKAMAIYEKLSLLNPEKSDYFAQKIEKLRK
jgi:hypothetical protein